MARDSLYQNNFSSGPSSANGESWIQSGGATNVGVSGGALNLFTQSTGSLSGSSFEGGKFAFPSSLIDEERVDHFTASMDVSITSYTSGLGTRYGNKLPDGISFSFGNTSSFGQNTHSNVANSSDFEKGVYQGLSVSIIPFEDKGNTSANLTARGTLQIRWNGVVIGSSSFGGTGNNNSAAINAALRPFTISVADDGKVSASFAGTSVTATIPNNQWTTVDQSGWDFAIAGRTGANGGTAKVDNLRVESHVLHCFARGTMILCGEGLRAVETLVPGDLVMTRDRGLQPIRWISSRKLSREELELCPQFRPIRIAAGALGKNMPSADLVVSPQHRVLVHSAIALRMFGAMEVLVAAKHLCQIDGVNVADDMTEIEYFHVMFDQHEVVISNGAETESLFAGPQVLKSLSTPARTELFALFPELANDNHTPEPARPIIPGRAARNLARRHLSNAKPLAQPVAARM